MSELSREARALLASVRSLERASDENRARIRGKLSRRLAAGVAVGTAVTASATAAEAAHVGAWATAVAWLPAAAKIISIAIVAGVVSVGAVNVLQTGSVVGNSKSHGVSRNIETSAAPATKNVAIKAAPAASVASKVPVEVLQPRLAPSSRAAPAIQPVPLAASSPASRDANQRRTMAQDRETPAQQQTAAPESSSAVRSATPASDSLSSQISAMREARAQIRNGNARAALAVLDRQFPSGQDSPLLPEATLARIAALCALGDAAGARHLADDFLSRYPGSTLASRVRTSCAYAAADTP